MTQYKNITITWEFLDLNTDSYFIYGDDLIKSAGQRGAAKLKDHPHSIGFITRKYDESNDEGSYYRPEEYAPVFFEELSKLERIIKCKPNKMFYIPKIGSGPSNRYFIWEKIIQHNLTLTLQKYENVVFCWKDSFCS